jgi:hypothetical protein
MLNCSDREVVMRLAKTALGVTVLGSLLISGASAFGATAPAGGTIKVWATENNSLTGGTAVITGAIGDYGTFVDANSAGKIDKKNGLYIKIFSKKGTVLINSTQFNAVFNNAQPTDFNAVTCSASIIASAPMPIVSGTKAYAGITGSVTVTGTFAFILPRTSSGKCNTSSNAKAIAQYSSITGSGTVSFP